MVEAAPTGPSSTAPEPTIEVPPLQIEVDSVASFGEALLVEAEDVGTLGATIQEQLKDPADKADKLNKYATTPFGADPRQETLNHIATRHSLKMDDMRSFITKAQNGLRGLGNITATICAEFGGQDALNGADANRIRAIIEEARVKAEEGSANG